MAAIFWFEGGYERRLPDRREAEAAVDSRDAREQSVDRNQAVRVEGEVVQIELARVKRVPRDVERVIVVRLIRVRRAQ